MHPPVQDDRKFPTSHGLQGYAQAMNDPLPYWIMVVRYFCALQLVVVGVQHFHALLHYVKTDQ